MAPALTKEEEGRPGSIRPWLVAAGLDAGSEALSELETTLAEQRIDTVAALKECWGSELRAMIRLGPRRKVELAILAQVRSPAGTPRCEPRCVPPSLITLITRVPLRSPPARRVPCPHARGRPPSTA